MKETRKNYDLHFKEAKELALLKKQLQDKETELEILKKAMGIIFRSDH